MMKARSSGSSTGKALQGGALALALGLGLCALPPWPAGATLPPLLPSSLGLVEPIQIPLSASVPVTDWRPTALSRELASKLRRSPLESAEERALRIAEHTPEPLDVPPARRADQRAAALKAAARFEAAADFEAARFALERAVALGAEGVEVWRDLARLRLLLGDGPAAEAALLAALEPLSQATDPIAFVELRSQIHRALAKLYRLEGRARDAEIALDAAEGLTRSEPTLLHWLAVERFPIDLRARPVQATEPLLWPEAPSPSWMDRALVAARRAQEPLPGPMREGLRAGRDWLDTGARRKTLTTVALGLLGLFLLLRMIRQRGDLIVTIDYPEELRGVFRVRLASSKSRHKRGEKSPRAEIMKGGVSTHYEHHQVNRETHFHRLLSRRYYVTVEGMLTAPGSEEILGDFYGKKMVRVRHRRTVRAEYDAGPSKCPVDVVVLWDERSVEDVAVVARGKPETLKRSRGNVVRIFLEKGHYSLVVGCGDRVLEHEVEVQSFRPSRVPIDLAGGEVVFKGCPPAVEPYLRGDIEGVARALERDGQAIKSYVMMAQLNRDRGEPARAADYYESAGMLVEAANLRASIGDYVRAATLFTQAREHLEAAEMYRRADELVLAGEAYEAALDLDRAIVCYREVGAVSKWINALERRGETFVAAKTALEHDQRPRAIRLLQCIAPEDQDYAEASWLLAAAFEREGHWDLAAQKLEQHIATYQLGTAPADKYSRLADLLEQAGSYERALEVLESLRRREPTYPNVAPRIEQLRKQRSAAERLGRISGGSASGDAATAFVSQYRYEILEEIGRGGMGVVFKARDRRLDRIVALKRLLEDLRHHQARAVQLFLREAQAAARLNHPNIVTVYDTDQEDGVFFITMELLHGQPFHRILKESGRLSSADVVRVGAQVAAGLEYAHSQGIVHRDIKTANLFLTSDNVVKIMDFGLAKMFEEVRGSTTVVSGTPFYMSPEQIVGGPVDQRTDLYSLGVTLFELATGEVPFAQGEIAYHHRHTAPPDPRSLVPEMPDAFAEVLLLLLRKDPEERCGSAEDLHARLEDLARRLQDSDS